jgi:hypothetical protein
MVISAFYHWSVLVSRLDYQILAIVRQSNTNFVWLYHIVCIMRYIYKWKSVFHINITDNTYGMLFSIKYYTCQVTRLRRVIPGNRACHPHFPEHRRDTDFTTMTRNHPKLVQILEIFIYSENTEIFPIERTTIRMVNYNQQQCIPSR